MNPTEHKLEPVVQSTTERKSKLIIVSTVHHRDTQGQIQSSNCRISRTLDSKETTLKRTMIVRNEWVKIDTGWIKDVGYLMVNNLGGQKFNKTPTPEQVAKARAQIIELGYRELPERKYNDLPSLPFYTTLESTIQIHPLFLVHPHECFQGKPIPNLDLWMCCQLGEVSVTYIVVPN